MAKKATHRYEPDYAVPPGWVLKERLDAQGMTPAEFARRCGRSAKLISEIVAGKAPIEPRTALQFEKVLGVDAEIWLGIEMDYRLQRTRAAEAEEGVAAAAWSRSFPIRELAKRGVKPAAGGDAVSALLAFFGVASVEAWHVKYGAANVAYRHSPSFESDKFALAAWLRLAEIDAAGQPCADYRQTAFKSALKQLRRLTRTAAPESLHEAQRLCNGAGVAFALVKPLPKTRLSGAAWWPSARRPVIALSARHKTDGHLWFSLFHEAAHVLLHGKKNVFVDGTEDGGNDMEAEANDWAANYLVPRAEWRRFVDSGAYGPVEVLRFAEDQGIAPGIIVGRLQYKSLLPSNHLNDLKVRLRWAEHPHHAGGSSEHPSRSSVETLKR